MCLHSASFDPAQPFLQSDSLILEDESGRISLDGSVILGKVGILVTGVVVAVKGFVDDQGIFQVDFTQFL